MTTGRRAEWAALALVLLHVVIWLFALAMLAIYPIFSFKGYKYNADTIQLVTFPLLMLAYLRAFEQRSLSSGVWLGLAAAAALLAKYWALTLIGAIGVAALMHPAGLQFFRSPAPWVALGVAAAAIAPRPAPAGRRSSVARSC